MNNKENLLKRNKLWRQENKERKKEMDLKWKRDNLDRHRTNQYRWYLKNKEKVRAKGRERDRIRRSTPSGKLQMAFSQCLRQALRGNKAGRRWESFVNYTLAELMAHLESQFDSNMNWGNYGKYWHVDHIKPVSLFKFESEKDPEFQQCWALENLQPLEAKENIRKSNKYPYFKITTTF